MKVLVIGGYGNFGKRLVRSLAEHYQLEIVIAGRSLNQARRLCTEIECQTGRAINCIHADIFTDDLSNIFQQLSVDIVVNAAGPYQYRQAGDQEARNNYRVARACIDAHCHYVDFADDRAFVSHFTDALNQGAKQSGVMLVTGASTVPGLSAAVVDHYLDRFQYLRTIHYGISPGNQTERGTGTVASILSYTGKPFSTLVGSTSHTLYGWQGLQRYDFGEPLGKRWMSNCNIPDLDLLPLRYPGLKTLCFKAGLEVTLLHCGLWLLSGLSRIGLVKNWMPYANPLKKMSEWFQNWGSDAGGMYVILSGWDSNRKPVKVHWQLIAENRSGANVPTISAELIVRRILQGKIKVGAMPCMGLFDLEDFFAIASRWGIYQREVST